MEAPDGSEEYILKLPDFDEISARSKPKLQKSDSEASIISQPGKSGLLGNSRKKNPFDNIRTDGGNNDTPTKGGDSQPAGVLEAIMSDDKTPTGGEEGITTKKHPLFNPYKGILLCKTIDFITSIFKLSQHPTLDNSNDAVFKITNLFNTWIPNPIYSSISVSVVFFNKWYTKDYWSATQDTLISLGHITLPIAAKILSKSVKFYFPKTLNLPSHKISYYYLLITFFYSVYYSLNNINSLASEYYGKQKDSYTLQSYHDWYNFIKSFEKITGIETSYFKNKKKLYKKKIEKLTRIVTERDFKECKNSLKLKLEELKNDFGYALGKKIFKCVYSYDMNAACYLKIKKAPQQNTYNLYQDQVALCEAQILGNPAKFDNTPALGGTEFPDQIIF